MIDILATLVIYQCNTNYLEYNAVYQTEITQTGGYSVGYKPVIPSTLVQYLSYHLHPQLRLRLG